MQHILRNDLCARYVAYMSAEQVASAAPDPKKLRALAHPIRWKLIDLLESDREG